MQQHRHGVALEDRSGFFIRLRLALAVKNINRCCPKTRRLASPRTSFAIQGWPNVGIIVGARATLVVDTGLGPRHGATVVREVQKLAKGPKLYLTTTHFHSEHASGDSAFPPGAILIRPAVQQEEMEARGAEFLDLFRGRSAQFKELLQDLKLRKPDLTFDREVKLDLGGVTARLMWLGAAHTRGDELTFVEQDSVLLPGDIVENRLVPSMPN